jgi:hypothetical protein
MADEKDPKKLTDADGKAAVKDPAAALAEIQATLAELDQAEEQRKAEVAKHGEATAETGKKCDALSAKVDGLSKQVEQTIADLNEKLGRLSAPLQRGAGDSDPRPLSLAFAESQAYRDWKANAGARKSDVYIHKGGVLGRIGSVQGPRIVSQQADGLKALLSTTAATRLIPPVRRDFVGVPAALTVRDLIPTAPIGPSSGGIEYIREVGFHGGVEVDIASASWSGNLLTINTAAAHNLRLGEWVELVDQNPAALAGIYVVHLIPSATQYVVKRSADPGVIVDAGNFIRLRVHGAAAGTAEGSAYPEATWKPQLITAPDVSIGHQMPITERLRDDDARLAAYLDQRMEDGVLRREEIQIISGSGVGANFEGILTNALVPEWKWSNGDAGDTQIDAIRKAMTILRIAEYPGTGLLLAPEDNQAIDLQKGTDGHYIVLQVVSPGGMPTFFSLPRVETIALAAGTAIVGSFGLAARLWIRNEIQVRITDSHEAEFTSDILRIKASQREVFELNRPEAFCAVTFDAEPVAAT